MASFPAEIGFSSSYIQRRDSSRLSLGPCPGASIVEDELEARRNKRKIIIVCILCLVFMIGEIVGGIMAGSLAIISDAAHLFSDIAGFLISLVALYVAGRPATDLHSYGYHRAEVVGAIFSMSLIWAVTVFLVIEAIGRVIHPTPVDGTIMMIIAVVGFLINIIMAFVLHGHGHHPGSTVSHKLSEETEHHQHASPRKQNSNLNMRSAFIHVIGDFVQSIGVLIASIIIYFQPSWTYADPVCTFLFSIIVFVTTFQLFREAIHVLMEGTPLGVVPEHVKKDLSNIQGVVRIHDLHIWSLSSSKTTITVHVIVQSELSFSDSSAEYLRILEQCRSVLCNKYAIHHSTIQIEYENTLASHCLSSFCSDSKY